MSAAAAQQKTQEPSMDEILASIRRIISDDQEAPKPEDPVAANAPEADDVLDLGDLAEPEMDLPAVHEEDEAAMDDVSFLDPASEPEMFDALPEPEPEPKIAPLPAFKALEPPVQPVRPAAPSLPTNAQERIMSSVTDQSVSQAFNMLAHTVLSTNARTLEDLVRDMLKPMLRTWIDDNLPTMVERLVKGEIERVARGGR